MICADVFVLDFAMLVPHDTSFSTFFKFCHFSPNRSAAQLVKTEESPSGTVVPIPVVIAISSKLPPPSVIGIKSVQRLEEEIIPMQKMKMGWFPYVPSTV